MTAIRYVTIWCDGKTCRDTSAHDGPRIHDCGEYVEGESAKDAREIASRPTFRPDPDGTLKRITPWLVALPNGRDLCPRHRDERNATTGWGDGL